MVVRSSMVRVWLALVATTSVAAIVWADNASDCVSDSNPCTGNYIKNGSGCSTSYSSDHYPSCCEYWEERCCGTQQVWRERSGWTFGESCEGPPTYNDYACPTWRGQMPPGPGVPPGGA